MSSLGLTHTPSAPGACHAASGLGMLLSLLRSCFLRWHPFPEASSLLCSALGGDSSPKNLQQVIS